MSDVDAILPFFPDWFRFDPQVPPRSLRGGTAAVCAVSARCNLDVVAGEAMVRGADHRFCPWVCADVYGCNLRCEPICERFPHCSDVPADHVDDRRAASNHRRVSRPPATPQHAAPRNRTHRPAGSTRRSSFAVGARAPTSGHSHCDRTRAVPCTVPDGLHQYRHDDPSRCRPDPCRLPGRWSCRRVPLWSVDPLPRAPSYPARLIDILVELQIHAVLGLILIRSGAPLISAYATSQQGATRSMTRPSQGCCCGPMPNYRSSSCSSYACRAGTQATVGMRV
ncbi:hypothetical protein SAMN04489742_0193 [Arthrobacter crystallopoietes]|uniref:Uncharacterized protein n=1 Tax=Crystallibacter crystallopoietes TaxID=37928 RepID=A0A1H0XMG5_9MICC|nr:hypothetical protein SAMN04489742_0193 [Arthrobacter crystallopoietes]